MKIKILIIAFSFFGLLGNLTSQKTPAHLIVEKCHDNNAGTLTSFYEVQLYQVGKNTYKVVGTFSNGAAYTVPGTGSVSLGFCKDNTFASPMIVEKCHTDLNGFFTSFYQVVTYDKNGAQIVISNFDSDGSEYTLPVDGTFTLGYCPEIINNLEIKCVEYDKNLASNHVIDYTLEMSASIMVVSDIEYTENGEKKKIPINYPYDVSNARHRANIVNDLKAFFDCKKITYDEIETETEMTGDVLTKVTVRFKRPSVEISQYWNYFNRDLSAPLETNLVLRNVVTNGSSGAYTNKLRGKAYYDHNGVFLYVKNEIETLYSIPSGMEIVDCDIDCNLSDVAIEEYQYNTRLPLKTFVLTTDYGSNIINNVELHIWKAGQASPNVFVFSGYNEAAAYQYANQVSYHVSQVGYLQNLDIKFYHGINAATTVADSTKIYLINTYGIDSIKAKLSNDVVLPYIVESEKSYITFTVNRNKLGGINSVIGDNGQKIYNYLPHGSVKLQELSSLEESNITPMTTTIENVTLKVEKCHDNGSGVLTSFYEVTEYDENGISTVLNTYTNDGSSYIVPGTGSVSLGFCSDQWSEKCIKYSKAVGNVLDKDYEVSLPSTGGNHLLSKITYEDDADSKIIPLNYPYNLKDQRARIALKNDLKELFDCKRWHYKEIVVTSGSVQVQKSSVKLLNGHYIVPQTFFQALNIDGEISFQVEAFTSPTNTSAYTKNVYGTAYYKNGVFQYLIDEFGDISTSTGSMEFVECSNCSLDEIAVEKYKLKHIYPVKTFCTEFPGGAVSATKLYMYVTSLGGTVSELSLSPGTNPEVTGQIAIGVSNVFVYDDISIMPNGNDPYKVCINNVMRADSITWELSSGDTIKWNTEAQNDYSYMSVFRNKLGGINKVVSEIGSVKLSYLPPGAVPISEPPALDVEDAQGSGSVTIPGHFKSINIVCQSADVTINGVAYPLNYVYNIPFMENGTIANDFTVTGTSYNYTVIR